MPASNPVPAPTNDETLGRERCVTDPLARAPRAELAALPAQAPREPEAARTSASPAAGAGARPGLRREEVAQLAGVGATWYTWLEQGRDVRASLDVLEALARALRLDQAERTHLVLLGRGEEPPPCKVPPSASRRRCAG